MPAARYLTHNDRAVRHQRLVAAYKAGESSRSVASRFGLSDSHVRYIVRLYGAARPRGRMPRAAA